MYKKIIIKHLVMDILRISRQNLKTEDAIPVVWRKSQRWIENAGRKRGRMMKGFKYLESFDVETEGLESRRIQVAWMNWKRVPAMLCNRRINIRKREIFPSRPATIFASETLFIKESLGGENCI